MRLGSFYAAGASDTAIKRPPNARAKAVASVPAADSRPEDSLVKVKQLRRYSMFVQPVSHPSHWLSHIADIPANFNNVHPRTS